MKKSILLIITMSILSNYANASLVARWNFDDKTASDISNYMPPSNGTFTGNAHVYKDTVRKFAAGFDGDGDFINCGNNSKLINPTAMTITAWIKAKNYQETDWQCIVSKGGSSWRLYRVGSSIVFVATNVGSGGWDNTHIAGGNISDNSWHHIAGVYEGTFLYLYIDGELAASKDVSNGDGYIWNTDDPVYIGGNSAESTYFNGSIDDVRIYNNGLTIEEISCLVAYKDWFYGTEPLNSTNELRYAFSPYDLIKLNNLGTNYCENLLDKRNSLISYTHCGSENNSDSFQLQFPDDVARFVEGLVFEDFYSPIVRLEEIRKLTKGLAAMKYPGTQAQYSFRFRFGGKTFLIFDDRETLNEGRLRLVKIGDNLEEFLKVGFNAQLGGQWNDITDFSYTDSIPYAGTNALARSTRYWNESPFIFYRSYQNSNGSVKFTGRYWLSDEDKPLEFKFNSTGADNLEIVVGKPGEAMNILGDGKGYIHLPDRTSVFNSQDNPDKTFTSPDFNYLILRKDNTNFSAQGYSSGLLVIWQGQPQSVTAMSDTSDNKGYSLIKVTYPTNGTYTQGTVWLYPVTWFDEMDMNFIYDMAENFIDTGELGQKGLPAAMTTSSIPAGLAAGAYLLTKYNDPYAITATSNAEKAVDSLFSNGKRLVRVFNEVRAAAWLVKTANAIGNTTMTTKYTEMVATAMNRMLPNMPSYSNWGHFYAIRACWLAYDATGNTNYLNAYQQAIDDYDIDTNGMYRNGSVIPDPGQGSTYFGALPLAAWGHAGMLDKVNTLINLDVPSSTDSDIMTKERFNDTGIGPWPQDDANPEYIGYCLKGHDIPQDIKYVVPAGSFPVYNADGNVQINDAPMLNNPFFEKSTENTIILLDGNRSVKNDTVTTTFYPDDENESEYIFQDSGTVVNNKRVINFTDQPLVYKFNTADCDGFGIDMTLSGNDYIVEVSPDNTNWYQKLNAWSIDQMKYSLDLSCLTGSNDKYLKINTITPPEDSLYITSQYNTWLQRTHCRYLMSDTSYFIYKLDLPLLKKGFIEIMAGNDYEILLSSDAITWDSKITANNIIENGGSLTTDGTYFRVLDISDYINNDTVYVKFQDSQNGNFGSSKAFLRRLTVYGIYDSSNVYVRLFDNPHGEKEGLQLGEVSIRKYNYTTLSFTQLLEFAQQWLSENYYEQSQLLTIEAEHYYHNTEGSDNSWQYHTGQNSIGSGYIESVTDNEDITADIQEAAHISYKVNFSNTGEYYIWMKLKSDNTNNNIYYGVDNTVINSTETQLLAAPAGCYFTWVSELIDNNRMTVNIDSAGLHTLDIWLRQGDVKLDRIIITSNPDYQPETEPCENYYDPEKYTMDLNSDNAVNMADVPEIATKWVN